MKFIRTSPIPIDISTPNPPSLLLKYPNPFPHQISQQEKNTQINRKTILISPSMVVFNKNKMGWLSHVGSRVGDHLKRSLAAESKASAATHVGILAFETAKTMSRLLSLYKSLSDSEISNLRNEVMKSQGVAYLNSDDESFLLNLACAERVEDLDKAATTVARLGRKCSDFGLNRFDLIYTDLKLGIIDLGKLDYASKENEKRIERMEKLITATSQLYSALESLSEMEISERKLNQWRQNSRAMQSNLTNFDLFNQRITYQRKQVRHFREISLWNQTFDKSVGLMARIVCIVYARICIVFGPHISSLPHISLKNIRSSNKREIVRIQPDYCLIEPMREQMIITRSGPIPTTAKPNLVRFHSQKFALFSAEDSVSLGSKNRVLHTAGPSTVGGSGLALRYANVISLAERYLDSAVTIGDDARGNLYSMLPENLKIMVRAKLRDLPAAEEGSGELAEGWREAVGEIMRWLGPVARDTVKWEAERNFEKMRFELKPPVLLLQTLHFSDREKVETAISEVLVGLSCVYRYENQPDCGGDDGSCGGGDAVVGGSCSTVG